MNHVDVKTLEELAKNVEKLMNLEVVVEMPRKPHSTTFEKEFNKKANANKTIAELKEIVNKRKAEIEAYEQLMKLPQGRLEQQLRDKIRLENRTKAYKLVHKQFNFYYQGDYIFDEQSVIKFMRTFEGVDLPLVNVLETLKELNSLPSLKLADKMKYKKPFSKYIEERDVERRTSLISNRLKETNKKSKPEVLTMYSIVNNPKNANLTVNAVNALLENNKKELKEWVDKISSKEQVNETFREELIEGFTSYFDYSDDDAENVEYIFGWILDMLIGDEISFDSITKLKAMAKAIRRLVEPV